MRIHVCKNIEGLSPRLIRLGVQTTVFNTNPFDVFRAGLGFVHDPLRRAVDKSMARSATYEVFLPGRERR